MLQWAEMVTAPGGVCREEQDWGLEVHMDSTVAWTYHTLTAANFGKTNLWKMAPKCFAEICKDQESYILLKPR